MTEPKDWKYISPETPGLHTVISPANSICKLTHIFRLNMEVNQQYILRDNDLELNGSVIEGCITISFNDETFTLEKYDSFYLPAKNKLTIRATKKAKVYIGGAPFDGVGKFFTRKFDLDNKDSNIRQVHGKEPYRRDVFMTVSQHDEASRLICGITSGDPGMWTSWPPHQHTKDLEEVYCYIDIPAPRFALHLSSRYDGVVEFIHPVSTGDCVIVPEGYHPTVGMPGVKSSYFWVMAAHKPESRRYDLAINDPNF